MKVVWEEKGQGGGDDCSRTGIDATLARVFGRGEGLGGGEDAL